MCALLRSMVSVGSETARSRFSDAIRALSHNEVVAHVEDEITDSSQARQARSRRDSPAYPRRARPAGQHPPGDRPPGSTEARAWHVQLELDIAEDSPCFVAPSSLGALSPGVKGCRSGARSPRSRASASGSTCADSARPPALAVCSGLSPSLPARPSRWPHSSVIVACRRACGCCCFWCGGGPVQTARTPRCAPSWRFSDSRPSWNVLSARWKPGSPKSRAGAHRCPPVAAPRALPLRALLRPPRRLLGAPRPRRRLRLRRPLPRNRRPLRSIERSSRGARLCGRADLVVRFWGQRFDARDRHLRLERRGARCLARARPCRSGSQLRLEGAPGARGRPYVGEPVTIKNTIKF